MQLGALIELLQSIKSDVDEEGDDGNELEIMLCLGTRRSNIILPITQVEYDGDTEVYLTAHIAPDYTQAEQD